MSADNERRARELLALEYERDGIEYVPECIRHNPSLTWPEQRAIRAIMAALDEPAGSVGGEAVAWSVMTIGMRGAAYDMPGTCRAYTYKHQPGNDIAYQLGGATYSANQAPGGDNIDLGLSLLKSLEEIGFGVFQVGEPTHPAPPVVDEAALRALVKKWRTTGDGYKSSGTWTGHDVQLRYHWCAEELEAALTQPSQPGEEGE